MNKLPSPLNKNYLAALIIVLIGAIHLLLLGIFNKNYVEQSLRYVVKHNSITVIRLLYIVIGAAALYIIFLTKSRPFLPFLDTTVMPPSLILLSEQADTNQTIIVNAPDAIKVMYWAANKDDKVIEDNPYDAYANFENIGVASVKDDKATLKLKCPTQYKVGKKILPKHVHYRLIYENGVISDIKTLNIKC
jgi:uncharacterized membrane protein YuzA (DUF378 family)